MKKSEVKTGKCYTAKVSNRMATIRIDAENPNGGWDATNLTTKKKVRIKSAQRLRHETRAPGRRAPAKRDAARAVEAVEKGNLAKGVTVPTASKKRRAGGITEANKADAVNQAMQAVAADKKKRASGLDAAAQVLAEAGAPLNTNTMVERMLAKGLWQTSGKTPAATIYAAILREINTKGAEARFRKVARGRFELAKGA